MGHCHDQSSCCGSNCSCGCQSKGCSCSCHKSQCGCQTSCGGGSCGNECQSESCHPGCNYAQKFLELADHAWMEVLKEKIKENIQANSKNMDELARLISEANHEKWQKKMEDKKCCGSFEERLGEFFNQACQQSCQNQKQKK